MARHMISGKKFVKGQQAATLVEYGLMLALIAVVCLVGVALIGTNIKTKMGVVNTKLAPSGGDVGDGGDGGDGGK